MCACAQADDELPRPEEIEVEFQDLCKRAESHTSNARESHERRPVSLSFSRRAFASSCLSPTDRHDEEQAYLTLMSQDIKSLNFPCEENYTVRLCKELVTYHNPESYPLGSFELIASNRIRSDEETLGEIFNGQPYYTDKEPAEDPDFDWVPRKEQVFSDKQLMQLSVWKKDVDESTGEYEPVDIGYKPYGAEQTRKYKKMGYLDEAGKLKS